MSIEVLSAAWAELKRYINVVDRIEAAETFINVMVDNDITPDDIRDEFKGDTDIKKALVSYLGEEDDVEIEEDEDYEDFEDNDE
jgi:hypothetical protein